MGDRLHSVSLALASTTTTTTTTATTAFSLWKSPLPPAKQVRPFTFADVDDFVRLLALGRGSVRQSVRPGAPGR